jgi:hypothetical protein
MVERATVRQKKTSRPVCFELTEQTRLSVDAYLSQSLRSLCHRQTLSRVPVLPGFMLCFPIVSWFARPLA